MNTKLCEKCKKNPVSVHYRETKNGVTSEMHLCAACAAELGIGMKSDLFGDDFLGSFPLFAPITAPLREEGNVCPVCKTPLSHIRSKGAFGCAACYDTFSKGLDMTPFIGRGYRGGRLGKVCDAEAKPEEKKEADSKQGHVEELRAKLRAALAEEHYEEAAILRDQIRAEEGK